MDQWQDATLAQPSDPLSAGASYRLRYSLSGILLKRDDGFELDHDFLFPDRVGAVDAFSLRLTLDPEWQTPVPLRDEYTAERVAPGRGYVLNVPLQYAGSGVPTVLDTSRRPDIVTAVWVLLGATLAGGLWVVVREQRDGRVAAHPAVSGEEWLRDYVLRYPAEVVGASWDRGVGAPEVVALIARMVQEGELESQVKGPASMSGWRDGFSCSGPTVSVLLVSRISDSLHKSRSAALGWQGARSEDIGNI